MGESPAPDFRAHRSLLFRKYLTVLVVLVAGTLIVSGLIEGYFSYLENQTALVGIQRAKATVAAARIEQFVTEIERQMRDRGQAPTAVVSLEQRRGDLLRLLRQAPALTEVSYLDPAGHEQMRVSRLAPNVSESLVDYSRDAKFLEAKSGKTYFSQVYFRGESEPYMTMGIADRGPNSGVTVAEVNLKFIWDVVSGIKIGDEGYAYVVDPHGQLVAHPDISLVLQKTDLSALPQVRSALEASRPAPGDFEEASIAANLQGRQVLVTHAEISPTGWVVLVEQPLEEVFAQIYASLLRSALLLVVGLALAILASLLLARRMVAPIRLLQTGAALVGAGALDQRIAVRTGDELEDLADEFNRMTERVAKLIREQEVEVRARERLEQEMRVAHLIQQQFLPKRLPEVRGWTLASYYRAARQVGGDFYDFIELPEGNMALVVGDVTGHGVPAALVMATTRSVLRSDAPSLVSPSAVLARANDLLHGDIPPNMFVTCLFAVLHPSSGRLRYANAGHDLPYLSSVGRVRELRATGMPLGLMPGMVYEEKDAQIAPGESLLLHSDGLAEAHDPQRKMYGFPRMREIVAQHSGGQTLIDELLKDLGTFTGSGWEQEDDITLVTLVRAPGVEDRELDEFQLQSVSGNEREAMERVARSVRDLKLSPRGLERLKTAVSEAAMNAIEHGNQQRAELPVRIEVSTANGDLIVRIIDHGGGREIPAATTPDLEAKLAGLQKPRGWGLFLIKKMVDDVRVTSDEKHHTVELVVRLDGGNDGGDN